MLRSASRNDSVWTLREAKVAGKPTVCYVVASGSLRPRGKYDARVRHSLLREARSCYAIRRNAVRFITRASHAPSRVFRSQVGYLRSKRHTKSGLYMPTRVPRPWMLLCVTSGSECSLRSTLCQRGVSLLYTPEAIRSLPIRSLLLG